MNIDLLIKMANQIGAFFGTESLEGKAPGDVAAHLKRYWDPRMREQIIAYYHDRQGAGLEEVPLAAVGLLAAEAKPISP